MFIIQIILIEKRNNLKGKLVFFLKDKFLFTISDISTFKKEKDLCELPTMK